jgi:hypothetical protein
MEAVDAHARLRAIPGVERIGFGLKEAAGDVVQEFVLRVYVRAKKPLDQLSPAEVIPPVIDGIRTDVVVLNDERPVCRSGLRPGDQITRDVPWDAGVLSAGSLGCVVQKGGTRYILTNHHVIFSTGFSPTMTDVYQPKPIRCVPGCNCNSAIATVVGDTPPWAIKDFYTTPDGRISYIDCGLLHVVSGVKAWNEIENIGAIAPDIRDVATTAAPPNLVVRKRGATTLGTQGIVIEYAHQQTLSGMPVTVWEMKIRPNAGFAYDETFVIDTTEPTPLNQIPGLFNGTPIQATIVDAAARKVRFQGLTFAWHGDSGSVVVDDNRKVVALVTKVETRPLVVLGLPVAFGVPTGIGLASHIFPIVHALQLNPSSAVVVSASPTGGMPGAIRPGQPLSVDDPDQDLADSWAAFEDALADTDRGRRLLALVREHHREVRALIDHHRPVTVTWHRNKGPGFVAALIDAARTKSSTVPTLVAGHSLETLLERMADVLARFGTPELRAAIAETRDAVLDSVRGRDSFVAVVAALAGDATAATA